jgi:hypothetical protein
LPPSPPVLLLAIAANAYAVRTFPYAFEGTFIDTPTLRSITTNTTPRTWPTLNKATEGKPEVPVLGLESAIDAGRLQSPNSGGSPQITFLFWEEMAPRI